MVIVFRNTFSQTFIVQPKTLWIKPSLTFFSPPMINSWLQCPYSTPCREFENSCWVSYGLLAWKNWVCYVSMHRQKGMLRSYFWGIRPMVFFSHAVTPTRGFFFHKFSWAQLALASSTSAICSHTFFGNMSPLPPKTCKTWQSRNKLFKTESSKAIYSNVKKVCFSVRPLLTWFASLWNCNREKTQLIFTQVDIFTKFELV